MTTINKKWSQALFPITTSSLPKLANCTEAALGIHLFVCFYNNHLQKSLGALLHNYIYFFTNRLGYFSSVTTSSTLKLVNHTTHEGAKPMASALLLYNYFFTSQTCKPHMYLRVSTMSTSWWNFISLSI